MHKTIKKIFKYTSCVLLSLLVILITGICYLYFSADMRTPKHESSIIMTKVSHADTTTMVPAEVLYNDTLDLRYYDGNFLRHSESGLWELFVKGCLSKGRSHRQTVFRFASLSGESICRSDS